MCRSDGLLCRFLHPVKRRDLERGLVDELFGLVLLRALQSDDERDTKAELVGSLDDALGDDIATHYPAEDVDEDGLDAFYC